MLRKTHKLIKFKLRYAKENNIFSIKIKTYLYNINFISSLFMHLSY